MNNKQENKFFNTDNQISNNINYSQSEADRRAYKYNNEMLPPLAHNYNTKKINKFYFNIKFPFWKVGLGIILAFGLFYIISHLPYSKLNDDSNKYCLVVFDYVDVYAEKVECGQKINSLEDPVREGYKFMGWYNGEDEFSFEQTINSNLTIVAKWEEENVED